jgi:hypothetical protein
MQYCDEGFRNGNMEKVEKIFIEIACEIGGFKKWKFICGYYQKFIRKFLK